MAIFTEEQKKTMENLTPEMKEAVYREVESDYRVMDAKIHIAEYFDMSDDEMYIPEKIAREIADDFTCECGEAENFIWENAVHDKMNDFRREIEKTMKKKGKDYKPEISMDDMILDIYFNPEIENLSKEEIQKCIDKYIDSFPDVPKRKYNVRILRYGNISICDAESEKEAMDIAKNCSLDDIELSDYFTIAGADEVED